MSESPQAWLDKAISHVNEAETLIASKANETDIKAHIDLIQPLILGANVARQLAESAKYEREAKAEKVLASAYDKLKAIRGNGITYSETLKDIVDGVVADLESSGLV